MRPPPDRIRFSSSRCHSETLIHLPGGVTLLLSVHNELPLKSRKSLLRRVFRQMKPVLREIHEFYLQRGERQAPLLTRHLDYRAALRSHSLGRVGTPNTLEAIRSRLGCSQSDLAARSGLSRYHLSRLEQGRVAGSPKTWKKIELALQAVKAECSDRE
jgi:DNA-binding XRE family transcriptional regulator